MRWNCNNMPEPQPRICPTFKFPVPATVKLPTARSAAAGSAEALLIAQEAGVGAAAAVGKDAASAQASGVEEPAEAEAKRTLLGILLDRLVAAIMSARKERAQQGT